MTLRVNTIEFNGEKAVINSYSFHPELDDNMNKQFASWCAMYPKAIVKNEEMPHSEVVAMVAASREIQGLLGSHAHMIGKKSEA